MNCTEALDLLQQRLDGEPVSDRIALEQHLSICSDCRPLHAAAARLEDGLRLQPAPVPPPGFSSAIAGRVLQDRRRRTQRRWVGTAALAASLLLAVSLRIGNSSWWSVSQVPPVADSQTPTQKSGDVGAAPDLRESVSEATSALATLTQRTASETIGQTAFLLPDTLPAAALTEAPMVDLQFDKPVQGWKQATHGMSLAFEPVTSSAQRAFVMLLRETPVEPRLKPPVTTPAPDRP